jgi:hypothetical protein
MQITREVPDQSEKLVIVFEEFWIIEGRVEVRWACDHKLNRLVGNLAHSSAIPKDDPVDSRHSDGALQETGFKLKVLTDSSPVVPHLGVSCCSASKAGADSPGLFRQIVLMAFAEGPKVAYLADGIAARRGNNLQNDLLLINE